MYERILVPTDGSECATLAIATAASLAHTFGATVEVVSVVAKRDLPPQVRTDAEAMYHSAAEEAIAAAREELDSSGIEYSTDILHADDHVHEAIIEYAIEHGFNLIVMGSHGRTGLDRILLGSVAERTIRGSPVPVLTIKQDRLADPVDAILVPTDGSTNATGAATHAFELARAFDSSIHIVHVVDVAVVGGEFDTGQIYAEFERMGQRAVDELRAAAEEAGVKSIQASILTGRPARSIVDYASDEDIDLVVLGTRGASGLDRYLLGSVAEKVVRVTTVPVMTLNAGQRRDDA